MISGALGEYLDVGPNGGEAPLTESDGRTFRQVALLARGAVFPGIHLKHEFPTAVDAESLLADPRNAALYAIALEEMEACRAELSAKKRMWTKRSKRKKKTIAKKALGRGDSESGQATAEPSPSPDLGSQVIEPTSLEAALAVPTRPRRERKAKATVPTDQLPLF